MDQMNDQMNIDQLNQIEGSSLDLNALGEHGTPTAPGWKSSTLLAAAPGPVVLLGAPGVGKGTQGDILARMWGVPKISTGEILRANVTRATALGVQADRIMRSGSLLPDQLINKMMADRLSAPDTVRGFILDGFPRTVQQALWLDEYLAIHRWVDLLAVISLQMNFQEVVERIVDRTTCPCCNATYNTKSMPPRKQGICDNDGAVLLRRDDDNVEVLRHRLEIFKRKTEPLIEHYEGYPLFIRINADRNTSVVAEEIAASVERRSSLMTDAGQIRAAN
jgi:adenylate kinase